MIRGQTSYVDRKSKNKITNDIYLELYQINDVANSINLWNRLIEKLKIKLNIVCAATNFFNLKITVMN